MPLNDSYEPRGTAEDDILDLLEAEDARLGPRDIYDDLEDVNPGTGQHAIYRLHAAGWINRPRHGLYEFRIDPREASDEELAEMYARHAAELSSSTAVRVVLEEAETNHADV